MIIVQYKSAVYINVNRPTGLCKQLNDATKFSSVFGAMKYLAKSGNKDITDFKFIDKSSTGECRKR
jgi:hypothetical protein